MSWPYFRVFQWKKGKLKKKKHFDRLLILLQVKAKVNWYRIHSPVTYLTSSTTLPISHPTLTVSTNIHQVQICLMALHLSFFSTWETLHPNIYIAHSHTSSMSLFNSQLIEAFSGYLIKIINFIFPLYTYCHLEYYIF